MLATLRTALVASAMIVALTLSLASFVHADERGGFCNNNGKHVGWSWEKWHYMYERFCSCH